MPTLWKQMKDAGYRANDLLRHFGISEPAVDVEAIATSMGIEVRETVQPGWSGALDMRGETPVIWVQANEVPARKRFTIAHELGHLLLHPVRKVAFRDRVVASNDGVDQYDGTPKQEYEANDFAASLLMPLWMLDPLVMEHGADAMTLAQLFGVSKGAMRIRLGRLA
ncbi:ImmA/IrrE family metallo-endopeptidase [Vulgatibacter sp.]|uniref:ImmA/IrrE family metallo-endopeptidase n=1 Tax=Vulgatibacter sp. TaxID=1971226 RepID=UPI003566535E